MIQLPLSPHHLVVRIPGSHPGHTGSTPVEGAMKSPEELQALVKLAKDGNSTAFSTLYEHYVTPIFRFVYFRVRSRQDAEDLTQHIFLKAWSALPEFKHQGKSFSAWLYRIARNTTIDYWRKKKETSLDPGAAAFLNQQDESPLPDTAAENKENAELLRKTLQVLNEDQQTVLTLKFIEDLSNKEIAQITGKTEGAIRQIQSRALRVLRQHLKEHPI